MVADRSFASVLLIRHKEQRESAGGSRGNTTRRRQHEDGTPIFHRCRSFCSQVLCFMSKYHFYYRSIIFPNASADAKSQCNTCVYPAVQQNHPRDHVWCGRIFLAPPETDCHVDPFSFFKISLHRTSFLDSARTRLCMRHIWSIFNKKF